MQRITASLVAAIRAKLLAEQGGGCALCGRKPKVPCLDHCHTTGELRGVLCRGCNAMAGHIENNRARHDLRNTADLARFLDSLLPYLHKQHHGMLHHTFRTEDEKRELRNRRARLKRAKEKL